MDRQTATEPLGAALWCSGLLDLRDGPCPHPGLTHARMQNPKSNTKQILVS